VEGNVGPVRSTHLFLEGPDLRVPFSAAVPVRDAAFRWTGRLPAGVPVGRFRVVAGTQSAPVSLLPATMPDGGVQAAPPPIVGSPVQVVLTPPVASPFFQPAPGALLSTIGTGSALAVGGSQHTLLGTANGGARWSLVPGFPGTGALAISFPTASSGWAVTDCAAPEGLGRQPPEDARPRTCLWSTANGGHSWQLDRTAPAQPGWVDAFPQGQAVVITEAGGIYRTDDAGATWVARGVAPGTPLLAAFGSPDLGVAVVGQGATLAVTADGGRTWTLAPLPTTPIADLSVTRSGVIWMLRQTCANSLCATTLLRSSDAGARWSATRLVALFATPGDWRISGVSAETGWLMIPGYAPYHTLDGGRAWTPAAPPAQQPTCAAAPTCR
jgi:hypothetical protein